MAFDVGADSDGGSGDHDARADDRLLLFVDNPARNERRGGRFDLAADADDVSAEEFDVHGLICEQDAEHFVDGALLQVECHPAREIDLVAGNDERKSVLGFSGRLITCSMVAFCTLTLTGFGFAP